MHLGARHGFAQLILGSGLRIRRGDCRSIGTEGFRFVSMHMDVILHSDHASEQHVSNLIRPSLFLSKSRSVTATPD